MSRTTKKRKVPKAKRKRKGTRKKPSLYLEYYQPVFHLLNQELLRISPTFHQPHEKRNSYWHIVPSGIYPSLSAKDLVEQYLNVVEKELARLIGQHSLGYWLHLYRRLFPGPIGTDTRPGVTGLVRPTLEAAIQKYGRAEPCDGVGISGQVPDEAILNGALMHPQFTGIRKYLREQPQVVLTRFGLMELKGFYEIEKLAYEVWESTAKLRIIGKGAPIIVEHDPVNVYDGRTDELDALVTT